MTLEGNRLFKSKFSFIEQRTGSLLFVDELKPRRLNNKIILIRKKTPVVRKIFFKIDRIFVGFAQVDHCLQQTIISNALSPSDR